jgi:ketosteroid isomerase-like protein
MKFNVPILTGAVAAVLFGGVIAASASTRQPGDAQSGEERAIRQARAAQNRAIVAGDADLVASFWTEDVTVRRGLGQPLSGRADARKLFEQSGNRDSTLTYQREPSTVEVSSHWPLAFESGTWVGYAGGRNGAAVIRGRYSAQWVKRDSRWLIRSEVFVALSCAGSGCKYEAAP